MAEWNWASGELMANVDAFILEHGYGCDVELVPGATTTTFASMNEKGQPDVAGELWINAVREPLAIAVDEGRLHSVVNGPITQLGEGWWIPPYTAENHPELKTVPGLIFVGSSFRIRLSRRLVSLGAPVGLWRRCMIGGGISPLAGDSGRA